MARSLLAASSDHSLGTPSERKRMTRLHPDEVVVASTTSHVFARAASKLVPPDASMVAAIQLFMSSFVASVACTSVDEYDEAAVEKRTIVT